MTKICVEGLGGAEHVLFRGLSENMSSDAIFSRGFQIVAEVEEAHLLSIHERWSALDGYKAFDRGYGPEIGAFGGMPVCISMLCGQLEGIPTVLWHPTSIVVHHDMIDRWLEAHYLHLGCLKLSGSELLLTPDLHRALACQADRRAAAA